MQGWANQTEEAFLESRVVSRGCQRVRNKLEVLEHILRITHKSKPAGTCLAREGYRPTAGQVAKNVTQIQKSGTFQPREIAQLARCPLCMHEAS